MKIDIDQDGNLVLREVYCNTLLETQEGNQIAVCMRDDTFEILVLPKGANSNNWWRVNMQTGRIENMKKAEEERNIVDDDAIQKCVALVKRIAGAGVGMSKTTDELLSILEELTVADRVKIPQYRAYDVETG